MTDYVAIDTYCGLIFKVQKMINEAERFNDHEVVYELKIELGCMYDALMLKIEKCRMDMVNDGFYKNK